MLMHATAHEGCTDTVKESALEVDCGEKNPLPYRGLEPASVLSLAFQSDALPAGVFPPPFVELKAFYNLMTQRYRTCNELHKR